MGRKNLPVFVLEQVAQAPMQDTRLSLSEELTLFDAVDDRTTPITSRNAALQQILFRWPVALFSTRKP